MLSLIQPSEQLVTALLVGGATVSAAIVNATAQVKVAREARRNSKPLPPPSKRVRRWLMVGAALALGLGWNATREQAAASGTRQDFLGAGVTSMLGSSVAVEVDEEEIIVASLRLSRPMSEADAVALLHSYDLRAYAVDIHLAGDEEVWVSLPPGGEPAFSLPRARAAAIRSAWLETCALEARLVGARANEDTAALADATDTTAIASSLVANMTSEDPMRVAAAMARRRAERLAEQSAVIHSLRVLAAPSAATRAAQDPAVAGAELMRFDPGPAVDEPVAEAAGCEVVPASAG